MSCPVFIHQDNGQYVTTLADIREGIYRERDAEPKE
jgi:hypothetical protein